MPRLALALALLATGATSQASATWLYCTATGTDGSGAIGFQTTAVDVGDVPPPRLAYFKQRLLKRVTQADADARAVQADCFSFDDQLAAMSQYSHTLDTAARRLGWDHVTVVAPEDWLADSDIKDAPFRP
jgi:hypothetical protein